MNNHTDYSLHLLNDKQADLKALLEAAKNHCLCLLPNGPTEEEIIKDLTNRLNDIELAINILENYNFDKNT